MLKNARLLETTVIQEGSTNLSSSEAIGQYGILGSLAMSGISSAQFARTAGSFQRASQPDTTEFKINPKAVEQVVPAPIPRTISHKSHVTLMEWEGYVDEIVDDIVYARLRDVRRGEKAETELAEIPIEEFSSGDQPRLSPGVIFRWAIGISKEGTTQSRYSQLVVRDLPIWTKRDTLEAEKEALDLSIRLRAKVNDGPNFRSD